MVRKTILNFPSRRTRRQYGESAIDHAIADIPSKPMSLKGRASLMKADYDRLTTVVKASGMTAQ
jgi:hypothetical protein